MSQMILLTGASGLIGFRVLRAALSAGYTVRCTVRSDDKAHAIKSNSFIKKFSPGSQLSFAIVPNITADGAYDSALKDVTHVIHVGSPVPVPGRDPLTEVYLPTVKSSSTILNSALRVPTIERIVITSSIVSNLSPTDTKPVHTTPSTRVQPPTFDSKTFPHVFAAYHIGKIESINAADAFAREHKPHFSIVHVIPGYVFGANGLVDSPTKARQENSSNTLLLGSLSGIELPAPLHGGFAHIDDMGEAHLHAINCEVKDNSVTKSLGFSHPVVYDDAWGYVEKAYPKAVKEGVFTKGKIPMMTVDWDSSETEKELGFKFRSFESAVLDAAGQLLDLLGKERA